MRRQSRRVPIRRSRGTAIQRRAHGKRASLRLLRPKSHIPMNTAINLALYHNQSGSPDESDHLGNRPRK